MRRRQIGIAALVLMSLGLFTGCASSTPTENTANGELRAAVLRGVAQIRGTHDEVKLRVTVLHTLAHLRSVRASTPADVDAQRLAMRGFASTLRGIESRLAFTQNDSGNVEAATRDAKRADRSLKEGANLLRAAGRKLGIEVGSLDGY